MELLTSSRGSVGGHLAQVVDDENRYVVAGSQRQESFESLVVLLVCVGSPSLARADLRQSVDDDQASVRAPPSTASAPPSSKRGH
jgi:hypothetical protein